MANATSAVSSALEYIQKHAKKAVASTSNADRRMNVTADTAEAAANMASMYGLVVGYGNVSEYNSIAGTNYQGHFPSAKFAILDFATTHLRDLMLQATQDLIAGNPVTLQIGSEGTYTVDSQGRVTVDTSRRDVTVEGDDDEKSLFDDPVTYIVIGAALIIIMLLWDDKKK